MGSNQSNVSSCGAGGSSKLGPSSHASTGSASAQPNSRLLPKLANSAPLRAPHAATATQQQSPSHNRQTDNRRAAASSTSSKQGSQIKATNSPAATTSRRHSKAADKLIKSIDKRAAQLLVLGSERRVAFGATKSHAISENSKQTARSEPPTVRHSARGGGIGTARTFGSPSASAATAAAVSLDENNGDVFIYPQQYRDLNECQKCARDNKICSCNLIEDGGGSPRPASATGTCAIKGEISGKNASGDSKRFADQSTGGAKAMVKPDTRTLAAAPTEAHDNRDSATIPPLSPFKGAFRISVATALIDQQSNQLRLSAPKIVCSQAHNLEQHNMQTSRFDCRDDATTSQQGEVLNVRCAAGSFDASSVSTVRTDEEFRAPASPSISSNQIAAGTAPSTVIASLPSAVERLELEGGVAPEAGEHYQSAAEDSAGIVGQRDRADSAALVTSRSRARSIPFAPRIANGSKSTLHTTISSMYSIDEDDATEPFGRPIDCHQSNCDLLGQLDGSATPLAASETNNQPAAPALGKHNLLCHNSDGQANDGGLRHGSEGSLGAEGATEARLAFGTELGAAATRCDGASTQTDEHLMYKLSLGDSIKISDTTSISLAVGRSGADNCEPRPAGLTNHMATSKRKNHAFCKLSRQAILDEPDDDMLVGSVRFSQPQPSPPPASVVLSTTSCASATMSTCTSITNYSPILSGVRDYIETVNQGLTLQQSVIGPPGEADGVGRNCAESNNDEREQQIVIDCCNIVSAPEQLAGDDTVFARQEGNGSSLTVASVALRNNQLQNILDSPKKSIFDGASKDEILEYLEDARERVPEALIAADDVMVMNGNELVLVNQLEPNLPATPISIVEAGAASVVSTLSMANLEQRRSESACSFSPHSERRVGSTATRARYHHQLGRASRNSVLSCATNTTNTSEIELASTSDDALSPPASCLENDKQQEGKQTGGGQLNESRQDSSEAILSLNSSLCSSNQFILSPAQSVAKNFSFMTGETLDSFDFQVGTFEASTGATANEDQSNEQAKSAAVLLQRLAASGGEVVEEPAQQLQRKQRRTLGPTQSSMSNSSNKSNEGSTEGHYVLCYTRASQRLKKAEAESKRRKSISESATGVHRPGGAPSAASDSLQMLLLQQHCLKSREPLSSCSSPPSSTSPSSSTSSNQTSGNCSAASLFNTSSLLSCSSPFLSLNSAVTSPAFNRSTDVAAPLSRNNGEGLAGSRAAQLVAAAEPIDKRALSQRDDSGLSARMIVNNSTELEPNQSVFKDVSPPEAQSLTSSENGDVRLGIIDEMRNKQELLASEKLPDCDSTRKLVAPASALIKLAPQPAANSAKIQRETRPSHGLYATINRLNNYLSSRADATKQGANTFSETTIEFQCRDCDQYIYVDESKILLKTRELLSLEENGDQLNLETIFGLNNCGNSKAVTDQLDRAYIVAMNGLPLCNSCEKNRVERKEILAEFVDTELRYGRDLKIIHDEFYRPMQIAGLLTKEQINGVFLNLEELIMANIRFSERLKASLNDALSKGDTDYNTVSIGKLFVESADMLHTFESYCIRQGAAACLLARLAKEKELLRIFLRVSQMENTLLRRMNLAAFLMIPVQRVTKYPLLLNRLYRVTPYYHKDREALRDAQLKVELHLEHINQQTRGVSATNKIWRRISNLSSAPVSNSATRRGLLNAEDISYIKLRKTALDLLKWDRDETQFIHSGKVNFAPLNEYMDKKKVKSLRYMPVHALLIVLGKPNWQYRPDLVKPSPDNKLMVPAAGGTGIREAALLLFREKNGRFVACREPLFVSNCVLSSDCSQYNTNESSSLTGQLSSGGSKQAGGSCGAAHGNGSVLNQLNSAAPVAHPANRKSLPVLSSSSSTKTTGRENAAGSKLVGESGGSSGSSSPAIKRHQSASTVATLADLKSVRASSEASCVEQSGNYGDSVSVSSLKSLPEEQVVSQKSAPSPTEQKAKSVNNQHQQSDGHLAKCLSRYSNGSAASAAASSTAAALVGSTTILNQLVSKVNSYHQSHRNSAATKVPSSDFVGGSKSLCEVVASSSSLPTSSCANKSTATDFAPSEADTKLATMPLRPAARNSSGSTNEHLPQQLVGTSSAALPPASQAAATTTPPQASLDHNQYNHLFFNSHHHQPYGDYEESFEIHERLSKESFLLRADTPLKTRYWLQILRYHAKDLGAWRARRHAFANLMMMRHE